MKIVSKTMIAAVVMLSTFSAAHADEKAKGGDAMQLFYAVTETPKGDSATGVGIAYGHRGMFDLDANYRDYDYNGMDVKKMGIDIRYPYIAKSIKTRFGFGVGMVKADVENKPSYDATVVTGVAEKMFGNTKGMFKWVYNTDKEESAYRVSGTTFFGKRFGVDYAYIGNTDSTVEPEYRLGLVAKF